MTARLLIANRGEIAVRIIRSARAMGIETVAIYSEDDAEAMHVFRADQAVALGGTGVAAYLDIDRILDIAEETEADTVHPGYGLLSENPIFAAACARRNIAFIGPIAAVLQQFGEKSNARKIAREQEVPILRGTERPTTLEEAREFFLGLGGGAMIVKAIAGGGGRGVRIVSDNDELDSAFSRCASEAENAFGNPALYVEEYLGQSRHIEVQILGDQTGNIVTLGDRDCTFQRRHQKLIEIAPAPLLPDHVREAMAAASIRLGKAVYYQGAGTIEFLYNPENEQFAFIEANARLQVEHTVTETILGIDIVEAQLRIGMGERLTDFLHPKEPHGFAVQLRINTELMTTDGTTMPQSGTITAFNPPYSPNLRLDTCAFSGYRTNPHFDSMIGKLIVFDKSDDHRRVMAAADVALSEFQIEGIATNIPLLRTLITREEVQNWRLHTRFIDDNVERLVNSDEGVTRYPQVSDSNSIAARQAGASIDTSDPLAVLAYGQSERSEQNLADYDDSWLLSPMQGTIIELNVIAGDVVRKGQTLLIMDSMKMEHEIKAPQSGRIDELVVEAGTVIPEQQPLLQITAQEGLSEAAIEEEIIDPDYIRPDLQEVVARRQTTLDEFRPKAVEKRRNTNQYTARENINNLCDSGTFVEYGQMVLAAQRRRRSIDELIEKSPADGMITGVGAINGTDFGDPDSRCVVMSYDYTVFAGTQGGQNHRKTDRMIRVAEDGMMPMVLFAEGGGGRPGDTDGLGGEGTTTFARFAQLSGLVPMIGITSGRCFAGNASLLGCCDVIIATDNANIGMGGPAMIEGGGLGIFSPEEIGPVSLQYANGVVDLAVADEREAVSVAKKYLSYFQGNRSDWTAPDQRPMRHVIPENRLRAYEVRDVITTMADEDSVLFLREGWGHGTITAFIRVEGMPIGVVANNPQHLGGAIDSDGADKAARFMQLCDAFDIPLLYLCDTPGIMVGPEIEKTALVRHSSRMFLTGANLSVPFFTIILRKAYGLGAIAMAGGSYKTPFFTVAWPTGEFGGMGLEGSVKLGYRNELAAIEDPEERREKYEEMVAKAYQTGKALNYASLFSVDDTIDPADSRFWVASLMKSVRKPAPRTGKKRPCVDAW